MSSDRILNEWMNNPSGRTMALGSTQPLTEMSTRNISWGGVKAFSKYSWPYNLHVPSDLKTGSLNLLEPLRPVQGSLYHFTKHRMSNLRVGRFPSAVRQGKQVMLQGEDIRHSVPISYTPCSFNKTTVTKSSWVWKTVINMQHSTLLRRTLLI